MHKHLRRFDRLWIDFPIYFIRPCTFQRQQILARSNAVASILIHELGCAHKRHGWSVGSYVIMPDHVHFFCAPERDAKTLSVFMREWKSWTSRKIRAAMPRSATAATTLLQREFFDHVLRSEESYEQKRNYVRENPVRAGLVASVNDWPYVGTVEYLQLTRNEVRLS